MQGSIREFFQSRAGQAAAIVFLLLAIGALALAIYNSASPNYATKVGTDRMYVCSEMAKSFSYSIAPGEPSMPVKSPYSGKLTGYPAEECYWTIDGKVKKQPTYVLLNSYIGKAGPTFCPDCGRLVVNHNPAPQPGMQPPPKRRDMGQ